MIRLLHYLVYFLSVNNCLCAEKNLLPLYLIDPARAGFLKIVSAEMAISDANYRLAQIASKLPDEMKNPITKEEILIKVRSEPTKALFKMPEFESKKQAHKRYKNLLNLLENGKFPVGSYLKIGFSGHMLMENSEKYPLDFFYVDLLLGLEANTDGPDSYIYIKGAPIYKISIRREIININ